MFETIVSLIKSQFGCEHNVFFISGVKYTTVSGMRLWKDDFLNITKSFDMIECAYTVNLLWIFDLYSNYR